MNGEIYDVKVITYRALNIAVPLQCQKDKSLRHSESLTLKKEKEMMKNLKFSKKTRKAISGAMATMAVVDQLCGKEFTDSIAKSVMPLSTEDRLTFWNLVNISMNPNKETHVWYGKKCCHPAMVALVIKVQEMILERMNNRNVNNFKV